MVARRGCGGRDNHMMGDARDEELQELCRQVKQLTIPLDCQGARSEHGQSLGYYKEVHKLIVCDNIPEPEDSIGEVSKQSKTLSQVQPMEYRTFSLVEGIHGDNSHWTLEFVQNYVDWSKPPIFDIYPEDECDPSIYDQCQNRELSHDVNEKLFNDDYQEEIDDIPIFDVYEDVHVNDILTFNVYRDDESFDMHYEFMSYCYDHESSTKRIIKRLDFSFKEDGCIN